MHRKDPNNWLQPLDIANLKIYLRSQFLNPEGSYNHEKGMKFTFIDIDVTEEKSYCCYLADKI